MGFLEDMTLKALFMISLVINILMVIAFIIAIPVEGYSNSPSPIIWTNSPTEVGVNMTVSGQNFTPGGTAVLSGTWINYTGFVDKNGNTSWSFQQKGLTPYSIYAVDETTNSTSNTLTISPVLNDYPPSPYPTITFAPRPSPAFPMDMTFITLIATGTVLLFVKRSKKNR